VNQFLNFYYLIDNIVLNKDKFKKFKYNLVLFKINDLEIKIKELEKYYNVVLILNNFKESLSSKKTNLKKYLPKICMIDQSEDYTGVKLKEDKWMYKEGIKTKAACKLDCIIDNNCKGISFIKEGGNNECKLYKKIEINNEADYFNGNNYFKSYDC
jgi:hypothetical protein